MSQPEKCFKCNQIPDDILMLACNHDLCLLCAANSFANQTQPNGQKMKKEFYCDLCGGATELDTSSVYELEKIHIQMNLNEKNFKSHSKNKPSVIESSQKQGNSYSVLSENKTKQYLDNNQRSYSNLKLDKENQQKCFIFKLNKLYQKVQPPRYSSTFTAKTKQQTEQTSFILPTNQSQHQFQQQYRGSIAKDSCQDHPDEDISYFCFDCLAKCICPECIIHGIHKNHEVKTIKKAFPVIKKLVEELEEANEHVIVQIEQQREEVNRRQNQQTQQIELLKQQIQSEFQILHQNLNSKEQELLNGLENIPKVIFQYQDFLDQSEQIENNVRMMNELIKNQLLQKEEYCLLNFYSDLQSQPIPKALSLPVQNEILINHLSMFDCIKEIKSKLETITVDIKEQSKSLSSTSPFKQEVSKMKSSDPSKTNRTLSTTNGAPADYMKQYDSKKKFQTTLIQQ